MKLSSPIAEGISLPKLVKIVGEMEVAGIGFESTTEHIDTGTAAGRMAFHVFAALAEFERRLIVERTMAGLAAERARGPVLAYRRKNSLPFRQWLPRAAAPPKSARH